MTNGFFSEEKVSEIRERVSIVEVVSDYVSLKKTGKNHKGLCPFHSEKTPSFMVNEEKQIFHCFGCGAGGDVFTFLMKAGQFTFPQAVEELAKRCGISLPRREVTPGQKREMAKKDVLFQINQVAAEYFRDVLLRGKEGEPGRDYLRQRGMSAEVVEEHRLGYAADRWDGLVEHLSSKKIPLELAWELGLVFPKKREGWYDAFRGRVLFPIFDIHHRVVGFGGRVIREGQPKYLNSPESMIYHKGEVLYGLQVAKQYATEQDSMTIVEGYFDLLTLHQHGLKNSVATMGTAVTVQHVRTLKRYTKNVITVFDADRAGLQATLRALPLFLEEGVVGKTLTLPKGEDPDGYLRKGHAEAFREKVAHAIPLMDFFYEGLMKTHDVKSIEGKMRVAEDALAVLRQIPDKIRKDHYLKTLADRLDVPASFLYEMLQAPSRDRLKTEERVKKRVMEEGLPKAEEMLVRLMIHRPEWIPVIGREGVIGEFEHPLLQEIAETLEELYTKKGNLNLTEAMASVAPDLQGRLCELVFDEKGLGGIQGEKVLKDCVQKVREMKRKRDERELLRRIREAERQSEGRTLEALLVERQELAKRERGTLKSSP